MFHLSKRNSARVSYDIFCYKLFEDLEGTCLVIQKSIFTVNLSYPDTFESTFVLYDS